MRLGYRPMITRRAALAGCAAVAAAPALALTPAQQVIILGAAFTPRQLFAGGVQGVWYDPSDLSTLFQDSAGTTPVTADGDPVGLIRDKSGNGYHASQALAGFRPLYKTSGGLHWLEFAGTDDKMGHSVGSLDMAICAAVRPGVMSGYRGVFGTNTTGTDGSTIYAMTNGAGWGTWEGVPAAANTTLSSATNYVLTMEGAATGAFRLNGASDGAYAVTQGQAGGQLGGIAAQEFIGRIYGVVARVGPFAVRLPSLERYLAKKAGLTL